MPLRTRSFLRSLHSRTLAIATPRHDGARRHHSWRVLKNRNFRLYFCGSVTSDFLGTWLQNTAQVLLAYKLANSVFDVGLVTAAQFTGPLLLGPWAGVIADRFGGRRTLLGTQAVAALVAFVMAALVFSRMQNIKLL